MSDTPASDAPATDDPGHADAAVHDATDDHGDGHGHDDHGHGDGHGHDDHGHGAEEAALGPIDTFAWGAGLVGVLAGLLVVVAFVMATMEGAAPV